MQGHKLKHSDALNFIFAGNSLFTVVNSQTGNRFTFKVKKSKQDEDPAKISQTQVHFVRVLTNPEVYEFIGTCFDRKYSHSKRTRISSEAQSVKVFNWIVSKLISGNLPEFIEIWHEGRCGKCGRVLTVPSSIQIGIGPECIKSLNDKSMIRAIKLNKILESI